MDFVVLEFECKISIPLLNVGHSESIFTFQTKSLAELRYENINILSLFNSSQDIPQIAHKPLWVQVIKQIEIEFVGFNNVEGSFILFETHQFLHFGDHYGLGVNTLKVASRELKNYSML